MFNVQNLIVNAGGRTHSCHREERSDVAIPLRLTPDVLSYDHDILTTIYDMLNTKYDICSCMESIFVITLTEGYFITGKRGSLCRKYD